VTLMVMGLQILLLVHMGTQQFGYCFLNGVPSITPDTTPPVITVLGDNPATAECSVAYSDAGATALDDVDGDLTSNIVTGGLPIDTSSTSSGNIVTYDVSDAAGNAADKEIRTVDVEDTTDPTITAPADITVDATGVLTPVSIGVATASDNCGLDTITNDGPTAFQFGDTVVTWTATDSSGNESTATQTIAVRTPGDTKDNIISALNDLNDQVDDKKTNKEIDKAIKHMTKSLKTILPDGEHLDEKQGKKTFSEERKAIKALLKIKDGETKCKGVTSLTLEYTGADAVTITFTDKKGNVLDEFTGVVSGDEVTLTASGSKLGSTTNVSISGAITEEQSIHTSCSKPIDVGDEYGSLEISDLETIPGKTKKGILPEELQDDAQLICDSIVNVDRIFAEVAIADATAGPQNDKVVKEIAKANKEMDKAQDDLDKGKLDKAIKHYEKAWKHAQHAIKAS